MLKHLIDVLGQNEVDWKLSPEQTTGPKLFSRELKWRDDVVVIPRETFYPYNWNERPGENRRWTYAAHLWEHSWEGLAGPAGRCVD